MEINMELYETLSDEDKIALLSIVNILPANSRRFILFNSDKFVHELFKDKIKLHKDSPFIPVINTDRFEFCQEASYATFDNVAPGILEKIDGLSYKRDSIIRNLVYMPFFDSDSIKAFNEACNDAVELVMNDPERNRTIIKEVNYDILQMKAESYSMMQKLLAKTNTFNDEFGYTETSKDPLSDVTKRLRYLLKCPYYKTNASIPVKVKYDIAYQIYRYYILIGGGRIDRFLIDIQNSIDELTANEIEDIFKDCVDNEYALCDVVKHSPNILTESTGVISRTNNDINLITTERLSLSIGNSVIFGDAIFSYDETDIIYNIVRDLNRETLNRYFKTAKTELEPEDLILLKDSDIKYVTIFTSVVFDIPEYVYITKYDDIFYVLFKDLTMNSTSVYGLSFNIKEDYSKRKLLEIPTNGVKYKYKHDI